MVGKVSYKLRALKKKRFLRAFKKYGVIGPACEYADVCRDTVSRWRKKDLDFAKAMQNAFEFAVDEAEAELRKRGLHGWDEPVLYKGEPIFKRDPTTGDYLLDDDFNPIPYTINKRSDRLLEVYTRSHRPQYKERSEVALTGPTGGPVEGNITVTFVDSNGEGKPVGTSEDDDGEHSDTWGLS